MKRITFLFFVLILVFSLSACSLLSFGRTTDMPFNGDIEFHSIGITIPQKFVRDSTQSNQDAWIFEHGWYSQLIILTRKDINGDVQTTLTEYKDWVEGIGGESVLGTFIDTDGVLSSYYKDNVYCQELMFVYDNSYYAVALRGGTQSEFCALLDTVQLLKTAQGDGTK